MNLFFQKNEDFKTLFSCIYFQTFAYVQQININATISGFTNLSKEEVVDNILQTESLLMFDKTLR